MERFRHGELQAIVATTVIEVGVDVPNATLMVVLDAERFGLSQLHQLRGRVSRGEVGGKCVRDLDRRRGPRLGHRLRRGDWAQR